MGILTHQKSEAFIRPDAAAPDRFEVINLGVCGFGTDQALLKLLVQGADFAPDHTVLIYFDENDPWENGAAKAWGVEKPRFVLTDNGLCLANVPPAFARGWKNASIANLVADRSGLEALLGWSQLWRFIKNRNVDPASTMQVVDALIRADKDFDFVLVPGAGHGVGESPYLVRRRQDFFVRHLLGVEPRR